MVNSEQERSVRTKPDANTTGSRGDGYRQFGVRSANRGQLGLGFFASFFVHANAVVVLLVAAHLLSAREQANKPEEVEIGFADPSDYDIPDDLPDIATLDPEPATDKSKQGRGPRESSRETASG